MSIQQLITAISGMQDDEAVRLTQEIIDKGGDAADILSSCQEAMKIVGDCYEKGDYFLPELILAGETLKRISEIIKPKLQAQIVAEGNSAKLGKIVLGTVRGDIHDIGKDIVSFMLDVNGFEVIDLGVDVPEEKFVETVKRENAEIVALSGFLTLAFDSMKSTVEAFSKAGLRDSVKIMIGGGQANDTICAYAAADAYGRDAMAAVRLAKEWIPVASAG